MHACNEYLLGFQKKGCNIKRFLTSVKKGFWNYKVQNTHIVTLFETTPNDI